MQKETEDFYLNILKSKLSGKYAEFIGDEIQKAYVDSYQEYGQNLFERYITYADHWCQDNDYRDPETGQQFDRGALNEELEKIETEKCYFCRHLAEILSIMNFNKYYAIFHICHMITEAISN